MKLLVSVVDVEEAQEALRGGADIVDVKNPEEGSLGAAFPWIVRDITGVVKNAELSATIGDLHFKPGQASQAAYGMSLLGVDYIKAGIAFRGVDRAIELGRAIVKAVQGRARVVLACYADYEEAGTLSPLELPRVAAEAGAHGVMIDTLSKSGKNLFDFMSRSEIEEFIRAGKELGLVVALAGSLKKEHIPVLRELGAEIAGFRGSACSQGDRVKGRISAERVAELKKYVQGAPR